MNLTPKQLELLKIIRDANPDKTLVDLDQLIERTSYKPSKDSMHFSVRALAARELIVKTGLEKRRGRQRVLFGLTPLGLHFTSHTAVSPFVVSEADDEVLSALEEILE